MLAWLSLKSVSTLAVGGAFGGMAFFSFAVAPDLFAKQGRETAGTFVRAFFPIYYATVAVICVVAAGLLAILRNYPVEVAVLAVTAFASVALRRGLQPRMEEQRLLGLDGNVGAQANFRRLHGLSMVVNLAQILAVGFVLMRLAA